MTSLFGSQSHLKATAFGVPAAAIKRGIEAQRLRQELLGDGLGLFCRQRVRRGTLGRRFGAVLLPKRAVRHSWATFRGCSVARGYGAALLGDVSGLFCRPSVRRGTLGQRFGAVLSPERTARHSWATFRGCSVAQARGAALLGNVSGLFCRPRVRRGTLGRRFGAVLSPERTARHSWATVWGCSVARAHGSALLGDVSGLFCRPRVRCGTLGRRFGAVLLPEGAEFFFWGGWRVL